MAERMSRAETVKRLAVKSGQLGEPAKVLAEIGGAAAFDDLVDILRNEPAPPGSHAYDFRCNVVKLLGQVGDERVIAPLLECHELYRAAEDLFVNALQNAAVSVPVRYHARELEELMKSANLPGLAEAPEFSRFRAKIDRTHLQDSTFGNLVWDQVVRGEVVKALEKLPGEGKRQALAYIFEQERNKWVRVLTAEALGRLGDPRGMEDLGEQLESLAGELDVMTILSVSSGLGRSTVDILCGFDDPRARQYVENFIRKCPSHPALTGLREYARGRLAAAGSEAAASADNEPASGCFIATAAYGSEGAPAVSQLRQFRDQRLRPYRAGRAAIALYEHLSPPLAEFIRPRPGLRAAVRALVLRPALWMFVSSRKEIRPRMRAERLRRGD